MLGKKIYRTLYRGMQDILLPRHKEFYLATLEVFHKELTSFSHGSKLPIKLRKNPRIAIKTAFREGNSGDLDLFFTFLPRLIRYFRAAKVLAEEKSMSKKKDFFLDDITKSEFNMAPGALMISKLFYTEKMLKSRNVDHIFEQGLKDLQQQFQIELDKVIEEHKFNRAAADGNFRISLSEKRRRRIFTVIKALDRLIQQQEENREEGEDFENLIDQVIQPVEPYFRAAPIVHSVIYCTLINSLGMDLEAFGVLNPKYFLTRIAVKNNSNIHTNLLPFAEPELMNEDGTPITTKKSNRISFTGVKEVNVLTIPGYWVCVKDDSFDEVQINYDYEQRKLIASYTASNAPTDETRKNLWELSLDSKDKHLIKIGHEYEGIAYPETAEGNAFVPASIKFSAISPQVIESNRISSPTSAPYIEMQVRYKDRVQIVKESDDEVVIEEEVSFSENYCRTTDLDWALLRISEDGVIPVTPLSYMSNLKK